MSQVSATMPFGSSFDATFAYNLVQLRAEGVALGGLAEGVCSESGLEVDP